MSSELITKLDDGFSNYQTALEFPHILLKEINTQPLPVVVDYLEEGDTPLYYEQEGELYELKRVDKSPLNLLKLLKVYNFQYHARGDKCFLIKDTTTLLEGLRWMPS